MSSEPIKTRALLVSRDIQAIEAVCHCAQQMGTQVEICADSVSATRKLCHSKYEAVILDLAGGPSVLELIPKLHGMTSHKKAVVFAICEREQQRKAAFQNGATLILEKSSSPRAMLRTFRAAYPMMLAERRRYFRYPVETAVFVKRGASGEVKGRTINVSEAGMAITSAESLNSGEQIELRLCLPGTTDYLTLPAQVCWTNSEGQAGVQFQAVADSTKQQLHNWLAARFEECTSALATKGI
jgi:DNA-binding response OmpR family regulator